MKCTKSNRAVGFSAGISALTLAAVLAASPASAQRVVVFGDSLSDTGNAQILTSGVSPPASPLGRYSQGLNWVDQLFAPGVATGIGVGTPNSHAFVTSAIGGIPYALISGNVIDYAVGGAYTGNNNLGTGIPGTFTPPATYNPAAYVSGTLPGITQEVGTFLLSVGTFKPTDLVTMWGGANNGFFAITPSMANPSPTQASISTFAVGAAADERANLQLLASAGAKKILVLNIPDLGSTPSVAAGGTAAVGAGNLFTQTFNAALAQNVSVLAAANPGANFIQADVASVFRVFLANPGAFGFTNATTPCGAPTGNLAAPFAFTPASATSCNGAVFVDGVHPSQAAYALLDVYLNQLLNPTPALQQVSRLGESGIYANELITNAVFDRMSGFISGAYVAKNGPYAEVLGAYSNYNGTGGAPGLSQSIGGFRGGIDKKSGASLTGASVSYIDGTQSSGSVKNDIQSWRADVYTTANFGGFYVSGDAGISSLTLNGIKRDTGFPTVTATGSTSGYVATASGEAGYVAQMGGFAIIPSGRVTYYHSQVNAYDETAPILNMHFEDRTIDAVALSGKVRLAANVPGIGMAAVGFGEVGYEGFVSSSSSALKSSFIGNTALPTIVNAGDIMSPGILGKVGLSTQISANAFIDLQYGIAVHDEGGQTHSGDLRIKATY